METNLFLTVDKNKNEFITEFKVFTIIFGITLSRFVKVLKLPKGSIKKLVGKEINYGDEPVELK